MTNDPRPAVLPALDEAAAAAVAASPLPTASTLRARRSLVVQAWRFAAINVRMMRMVRKGHH